MNHDIHTNLFYHDSFAYSCVNTFWFKLYLNLALRIKWEVVQDVLNVIFEYGWLNPGLRVILQINYLVPISILVSGNKAAQSGWAHYKVRWHQRAVKQCERRESEHILPLCVSRSLCSTKTDRAERLTRERETWQLRDLGAGERECAGVCREERERERERLGKDYHIYPSAEHPAGSHFERASGRCGISVRQSKWIIKQCSMWPGTQIRN